MMFTHFHTSVSCSPTRSMLLSGTDWILHTYQENQQNEKFNMLTELIYSMDVDFIAFQECAQHKSSTVTEGIIHEDNMALIISENLSEKYGVEYNFEWGWVHYGWDVWEEGVAVLSKHALIDSESRYISSNTSSITPMLPTD